ncbi:MAG: HAD family hydrolase [Candidatus Aenigmarchaeota archaeon]|nr:HAD family hydrolase [Candidatus Aenigmarchaeota archaeon]
MIKAIIFDWNGVIADSLKLDHQLFLKDVKSLKLTVPKSLEFYRDLFNSNMYENLLRIGFPKEMLIEDKNYKEVYMKNMNKTRIFLGMKAVLKILHKKYKIALITSNYDITVNTFNKKYGIDKFFDLILTADTHKYKTEKVRMFLERFSLKKDEVIFIGDTLADIKVCKKSGLKIIAVTWGYHDKSRLKKADPDFIANKPKDILTILNNLR